MPKFKSLLSQLNIDIEHKSKKWLEVKNEIKSIEKFLKSRTQNLITLSPLKKFIDKEINFEISISLCSNSQIKKINQQFRNIDKPTNVLSFGNLDEKIIQEASTKEIGLKKAIGASKYVFLGDIIFGYEYIKSEAKKDSKNFNDHLTHLLLHGILHLIGFDHENHKMAEEMENLEIKILQQLNINNPYK